MKTTNIQPNFEALKSAFYQAFLNSDKANNAIMLSVVKNLDFRSYHKKFDDFKKDFNKWLDGLDIRQAYSLIDILKENNKPVLKWMAKKQYVIDYNNNGALDLIRIENE